MGRSLRWCLAALACTCMLQGRGLPAAEPPLRFGLMPYAPAEWLVMQFRPLERYLERELGRRVVLVSAKDYAAFTVRMFEDEYDMAFTAPHMALLAVHRHGWQPLVRTSHRVQPAVIVRQDGPIRALADLRGRRLATPDRLALVTLLAETELMRAGIVPSAELTVMPTATHASAIELVYRTLADACVALPVLLERLPAERRKKLAVLQRFPEVFSLVYVGSSRLLPQERERLRTALMAFAGAPEGAAFYPGRSQYRHEALEAAALDEFAPLLPLLQDRLGREGAR